MAHHNASKTHCPQGHPYDEHNTYKLKGRNARRCKACRRAAFRKWYSENAQQWREDNREILKIKRAMRKQAVNGEVKRSV